jgi:hypothetical protein
MKLIFWDLENDYEVASFDTFTHLPVVGQELVLHVEDGDGAPFYEVVNVIVDYPQDTVTCFIEASPFTVLAGISRNTEKILETVGTLGEETRMQNRRELGETIIAMLPPAFCFDPEEFAAEIRAMYQEVGL